MSADTAMMTIPETTGTMGKYYASKIGELREVSLLLDCVSLFLSLLLSFSNSHTPLSNYESTDHCRASKSAKPTCNASKPAATN
jgi:hypothetical protein